MRLASFFARAAWLLPALWMSPSVMAGFDPPEPDADDIASLVDRFDAAVENGLPAHVSIPVSSASGSRVRRETRGEIIVERRLPVDLRLPGATAGTMYAGRLDGGQAVFTRAASRLDVSMIVGEGVRVVGYRAGRGRVDRQLYPASDGQPAGTAQPPFAVPFIGAQHVEDPLAYFPTFHIFVHDDLRNEDPYRLHARLVAWWIDDLFRVLPAEPTFGLYYYDRIPWVTDMDYHSADVLERFSLAVLRRAQDTGLPYGETYKHKFLLLTADLPVPGASGLAYQGQSEAIASVRGRNSVVAHEFGHLMGAEHQDAQSIWLGPTLHHPFLWDWCDTNMHATAPSALSCLLYSEANQRAIRSYQRHGPAADRPGVWLER